MYVAHTIDVNLATVSSLECSLHSSNPAMINKLYHIKQCCMQNSIKSWVLYRETLALSFLGDSPQKILSLGQFLALEYRINVLTFKPLNTGNQG